MSTYTTKENGNSDYLPALTGIRAIAAYMVFVHHYNSFDPKIVGQPVYDFFNELHIGVTFFFVLSGFLIAYKYFDKGNFDLRVYPNSFISNWHPLYNFG
jgi:peptidoglycan/LPS O-acetylase OafA/YrhL